ncbi:LuxR C-terminal-related transcriptional regulator [Streptomyces cinereoruber]|uniref:helix-turn-helix transcriptional regulator n=1 Tax=Streptomyces cinereoruber TaxID=67260 RepID=UPI003C2F0D37
MTTATSGPTTGAPGQTPTGPFAPPSPGLPLRGREHETARALRALRFVAGGGSALVAVEGPSGSGKTRFLDECVALARRLGYPICHRSPLLAATDAPATGTAGGPALVVLDDVHLLGEEVGDALLARCRPRYGGSVAWLVARRTGAGPGRLDALLAGSAGHTERITLDALRAPASLQVAADILGAPASAPLARVLDGAGGHPGLLVELVRGMREEHLVRVEGHQALLVEERIPQRVRELLHGMLRDQPGEYRQLLRVAAVLGRETTVDDLLPVLRVPPSALLLLLDRAASTGMLAVGDTRVRFPNELLRQVVADSVPAPLRHALRRQAAAARSADGPAAPPTGPRPTEPPDLNGQEHLIVRMIAEGLTNKQIARRLDISPHTVNYHLKKLFRKAGVNSRIALLRETGWHERPGGSAEGGPLVRPGQGPFEGGGHGQ